MGNAIQSLWDQNPNAWDGLPCHVRQQIYREANRQARAERHANAPGGYNHWLRASPIGPELERHVRRAAHGIPEKGGSLMLKDIVKVITRFQAYARMPLREPLRLAVLPVEVGSDAELLAASNRRGLLRMRIRVRFFIDWSSLNCENEWSPWLEGRYFTAAELGVEA